MLHARRSARVSFLYPRASGLIDVAEKSRTERARADRLGRPWVHTSAPDQLPEQQRH